jgi:sugar-specific transcriptional regulator TrmB
MESKQLTSLGLTATEAVIYSSVLKLGTCTVKDIAKDCGFHRTNIYDILEQLKEKGLVAFSKEGKVMKYCASDPHTLYSLLDEKRDLLDRIFPELEKAYAQKAEPIAVEVYKGEEGMKTALRDIVRERKPVYVFGVRGQMREKLPVFSQQIIRDFKNKKIPIYGIYTERGNLPLYYTEIRYVSAELSGPVATFIYGDTININIWEPTLMAIVIKSALIAHMYKKHFDLLWKIAEK